MTFVIQQAKNPEFAYSVQLLQNLHYMMTEHDLMNTSAGLWRLGPIWVKRAESGETVYDAPDPELVSALMRELVAHLQFDTGTPPLIAAAMAHLNLVMIHPFRDGNGRMARGLQTLVLAREGVVAQEYSSIEEYLGRERPSYYQILADVGRGRWNPDGDARPWVRYCLEAHFIQMTKVLRQVRETEEMWRLLGEVARTHRLPERTLVVLLLATRGLRIRNAAYRAALRSAHEEVSIQVATSDLAAIVRAGLLVQHGVKRGTYYVAGQALKEISQLFRDRRTPIDASHLFTPSPDLFATIGDLFTTSGASFPQSTASATTLSPQLSWQSGTAGRR
jgi:Fic family protein